MIISKLLVSYVFRQHHLWLLALCLLILPVGINAQFTEIITCLPELSNSSIVWGDYDNDGDLDVLISGLTQYLNYLTRIYRNDGNSIFVDINAGLTGVNSGSVAWGDYDNDGDLDVLISGRTSWGYADVSTKVYRNDGNGVFVDINAGLIGVHSGSVAWGDYDNDGDLDIVMTGISLLTSAYPYVSRVYRNDGYGIFTNINAPLTGVGYSSVAWGDLNNDGFLDIVTMGSTSATGQYVSKIYLNNGYGTFSEISAGLIGLSNGSVSLGDYDNDGLLDILITGINLSTNYSCHAIIYHNNGNGTFTNIGANITGVWHGSGIWGDIDNDGWLDVGITGCPNFSTSTKLSKWYHNNGNGTFTEINYNLPGVMDGSMTFADVNNDGSLDCSLTGQSSEGVISKLYINDSGIANLPPITPSGLSVQLDRGSFVLTWAAATDDHTISNGLTYNVRIGSISNQDTIVASMSLNNGTRMIPSKGNAGSRLSYTLKNAPSNSQVVASIQAIDTSFNASPFSAQITILTPVTQPPQASTAVYPLQGSSISITEGLTLRWEWAESLTGDYAEGYYLYVGTDGTFDSILDGIDVGNINYYKLIEDQLQTETLYNWKVIPYNDAGSASNCSTWSFTALPSYFVNIGVEPDVDLPNEGGDVDNDGDFDYIWGNQLYIDYNGSNIYFDLTVVSVYRLCDFDNDGDLDLLISGYKRDDYTDPNGSVMYIDTPRTLFYANNNATFTLSQSFESIMAEFVDIGDYDNNGFMDVILSGESCGIILFRNINASFEQIPLNTGSTHPSTNRAIFGDFDNDGDFDIIASGTFLLNYNEGWAPKIRYFSNTNGSFNEVQIGLTGMSAGSIHCFDYDMDGKLDFHIQGDNYALTNPVIVSNKLYRNTMAVESNSPPSVPIISHTENCGDYVALYWNPSVDDQTPSQSLTYSIKIGTTPDSDDVWPALISDGDNAYHTEYGYANSNCFWKVHKSVFAAESNFYWSVQAIDSGYLRSAYSPASLIPLPEPEVELLSQDFIDFGSIIKNEHSEWTAITLRNTGLGLQILNVSIENYNQNYEIGLINEENLGLFGSIASIMVRFTPASVGDLNGVVSISTNAINDPLIQITLTGIGLSVPPRSPDNVDISCIDENVVINWQPVTLDIHDEPITPYGYIVLFSEYPGSSDYYWFLGFVPNTHIVHSRVTSHRRAMFYRIVTVGLDDVIIRDRINLMKLGQKVSLSNLFNSISDDNCINTSNSKKDK